MFISTSLPCLRLDHISCVWKNMFLQKPFIMNLNSELSKAPFPSECHVGHGKAHTCPEGQWFSRCGWTNSIGMCLWEMQTLRIHTRPSQQGSLGLMPTTLCAKKPSRWVWEPLLWRSEQWLTLAFRLEYPTLINPPFCALTQLTFLLALKEEKNYKIK